MNTKAGERQSFIHTTQHNFLLWTLTLSEPESRRTAIINSHNTIPFFALNTEWTRTNGNHFPVGYRKYIPSSALSRRIRARRLPLPRPPPPCRCRPARHRRHPPRRRHPWQGGRFGSGPSSPHPSPWPWTRDVNVIIINLLTSSEARRIRALPPVHCSRDCPISQVKVTSITNFPNYGLWEWKNLILVTPTPHHDHELQLRSMDKIMRSEGLARACRSYPPFMGVYWPYNWLFSTYKGTFKKNIFSNKKQFKTI